MPDLFNITDEDKAACLKREVRMREQVYPRWVADGRMTQDKADWELAVMKAIAEDYNQSTHGLPLFKEEILQ